MSLESGSNPFFDPAAEWQRPLPVGSGDAAPAHTGEIGAGWVVGAILPPTNAEVEERVLRALMLSRCAAQSAGGDANVPITAKGDEKDGPKHEGPPVEVLERVLEGLRRLGTGSAASAGIAESETTEPKASEPKEEPAPAVAETPDFSEKPALEAPATVDPKPSFPVLLTFEEKPLFSPDATMVVSDQVRPSALLKPPVRPSKVVEAVVGSAAPGLAAVDPSEVTTVIADPPATPYIHIPPLHAPAETTLAFGDPAHTYLEGYSDLDYVEPLPQLPEHANLSDQPGVWVLPEHVGHPVVASPIESLPSDSLPGPTDVRFILDSMNHIDPQVG